MAEDRDAARKGKAVKHLVAATCILRAAALGLRHPPQTDEQRELAPVEGWILLPRTDFLPLLAAD